MADSRMSGVGNNIVTCCTGQGGGLPGVGAHQLPAGQAATADAGNPCGRLPGGPRPRKPFYCFHYRHDSHQGENGAQVSRIVSTVSAARTLRLDVPYKSFHMCRCVHVYGIDCGWHPIMRPERGYAFLAGHETDEKENQSVCKAKRGP
eukprot:scaffold228156_cov22-Prasinocladus_malaysianus.AAC.1